MFATYAEWQRNAAKGDPLRAKLLVRRIMSEASGEWRWVDADGVESTVSEWELVSSLSSGALPHYTLVWRSGWTQWLPACRVAELSQAVGVKAEHSLQPGLNPQCVVPPSPPIYRYRAFRGGEPNTTESGHMLAVSTDKNRPRVEPDQATLGRRPMPTLMDEDLPGRVGSTLRPPTAVPPPPRAVPRPPSSNHEGTEYGEAPNWSAGSSSGSAAPDEVGASVIPPAAPSSAVEPALRSRTSLVGRAPFLMLAPVLAATLGSSIVTATVVTLVLSGQNAGVKASGAALPSSSVSTRAGERPALRQCLLAHSARRLAPGIERNVPPELLAVDSRHAALGFASSDQEAVGGLIDAETLGFKEIFREPAGPSAVLGVVPVLAGSRPIFRVDRSGGVLTSARPLDVETQLGLAPEGLGRSRHGGKAEILWAELAGKEITVPRTLRTDAGTAVTLRLGGQSGKVLFGWLDKAGRRSSALGAIELEGLVGAPTLGATNREVLMAVAVRPDSDAKWGVALARARLGQLPKAAKSWPLPRGGPGVEAISPSVTGLSGGRWALQWTEGANGTRQVRVQILAPDLAPIGDAITLSAVEDNAGQGVVQAVGERVLSLFIVIKNNSRQLWGAGLECP